MHDQSDASCRVYTFKEGLMSAVAHDLEIAVQRFQISREGTSLSATFDARSLRVLHAIAAGQPRPDALSPRDREKIEATIASEVLHTSKHPEIRFSATLPGDIGGEVEGTLELRGQSKKLRVPVRVVGERYVAEVTLHQPEFGITPYSAMLGTLRIKPDVKVRLEVPRGEAPR